MKTTIEKKTASKPRKEHTAKRFVQIERSPKIRVTADIDAEAAETFNKEPSRLSDFWFNVSEFAGGNGAPHLYGDVLARFVQKHAQRPANVATITFDLSPKYWEIMQQFAADNGVSVGAVARAVVANHLRLSELYRARQAKKAAKASV